MDLNPEFMLYYLNENPVPYDFRKETKVFLPPVKSFRLGLNFVHFRGSIQWNNLSSSIKNSQTVNEFKAKLKNLGNIHCRCGVVETFFIIFNILKFLSFFFMYISQVFIYL